MGSRTLGAWTLALAGASAALAFHPLHEADVFWHLSLGRAVVASGSRVVPEVSAFPAFSDDVVVAEWLWGVVTYGLHQLGGYPALNALVMFLAAGLAALLVALLRLSRSDASEACVIAVSGLVLGLAHSRLRLRPGSAFLVILAVFIMTAQAFVRAEGKRRWRLGAALGGLELLWAQLHASFVLGPAIFALLAAPDLVHRWRLRRRPAGSDLGVLAALLAGCLTSAYGLRFAGAILAHASGDAVAFIGDMAPFSWKAFSPTRDPFLLAQLVLWTLGILGVVARRRPAWGHVGCAFLGLALCLNKVRFMAAGGVLIAPLALDGAVAFVALRPRLSISHWLAAAAVAPLLIWIGVDRNHYVGPLGRLGLAEGKFPVVAAKYLERLPAGSKVLTDYWGGAPIGFWLRGRVRTYVDGRTPLYFDDTDYALAREVWAQEGAFELAEKRYGFRAIVVNRNSPTCRLAAKRWVPVVVEPAYTTFAPPGEPEGLSAIAPCGTLYLSKEMCSEQGGRLRREIEGLAALAPSPFLDYLEARRLYHCADDPEAAEAALPAERDAWSFRRPRSLLLARIAIRRGDVEAAFEEVGDLVRRGHPGALAILSPAITTGQIPPELSRSLLEDFARAKGDGMRPEQRALLAGVCMLLRDAECVRFQGMRAAIRGSAAARPSLVWLRENHPSERVRADARHWLEALAARDAEERRRVARD